MTGGGFPAEKRSVKISFMSRLFELVKLYSRYMIRSILSKGIMRRKEIRYSIIGLALMWLVGDPVGVYMYTAGNRELFSSGEINMMYAGSVPEILPACIIIFLIIKILFGKATGLAQLTEQLPVTGRMKAVSFLSFEMLSMFVVFGSVMLPAMVGGSFALGATAVGCFVLYMILFPVSVFAVLNVLWQAVSSLLAFFKLSRYASICMTCVLIVLNVVTALNINSQTLIVREYFASENGRVTFFTFMPFLKSRAGFIPCALFAVFLITIFAILGLCLTPEYYQAPDSFVYIPLPGVAKNDFMLFLAYIVRLPLNIETLFLCVGLQIAGYFSHSYDGILLYSVILTFAAAYQFANGIEEQWRIKRGESAGYLYLCLVVSEILYAGFFWLISAAALALTGHLELKSCLVSFLAIVASSIIFTFIGIVFPSAKNNPFTLVAGAASTALLVFALALGEQAFKLNDVAMCFCRVAGLAIMAVYSVWAIRDNIKRRKIGKS